MIEGGTTRFCGTIQTHTEHEYEFAPYNYGGGILRYSTFRCLGNSPADIENLRAQLKAVMALHYIDACPPECRGQCRCKVKVCYGCRWEWPCPTVLAVRGEA